MPVYAQLDENNICRAIVDTAGPLAEGDKIIAVAGFDESVLGKRYEKGEWLAVDTEATKPITMDSLQADLYTVMLAIAELSERLSVGGV